MTNGTILVLIILPALFLTYFLPSIIARVRKHPQTLAIFLLNLFLGWSLIGWVAALVWSATAVAAPQPVYVQVAPQPVPQALATTQGERLNGFGEPLR